MAGRDDATFSHEEPPRSEQVRDSDYQDVESGRSLRELIVGRDEREVLCDQALSLSQVPSESDVSLSRTRRGVAQGCSACT